jgi:arsenite-transporting ATPase
VPPKRLDPREFLGTTRLVVVAGKGGVGKTTVTAVLARAAADAGLRVLAVDLDGKPQLAQLVDDLPQLSLTAPDALAEYLESHGLKRVAKRLAASGIIDVVSTAAPGIDDIVVLGKLKQLERSDQYDLIVVDGPAAGHAITFLLAARGLLDTVRGGPIRTQALDVLELLGDPDPLPGGARHPAGDHTGQRAGRDRLRARGARRRAARPRRGQRGRRSATTS